MASTWACEPLARAPLRGARDCAMTHPMRIATFNVNGVKARAQIVLDWLSKDGPDVALLQELKSTDEALPREIFEEAGYEVASHGQKGFNGVAIASRIALEDVLRGLPGLEDDQARWIEATVVGREAVRVCCLYLPNGNPAPGPKYDYKLRWMEALRERAEALLAEEEVAVMAGDYNVVPLEEDVARPEVMREDALCLPDTRAAFRRIVHSGWTDAFRARTRGPGHYTFWDYQGGAYDRNHGIRIDHALLSPRCADLLTGAWIERDLRARPKPSDHTPLWVELDA